MAESTPAARPLNRRRARFVQEYLIDLNAARAARDAGYSEKTARVIGFELLTFPDIQAAIARAMAARSERTDITQDRVLTELALLAFSDLTHYAVNDNGDVVLAEGAPAAAMRALQSIKRKIIRRGQGKDEEVTREVEIRLWDKPGPLRLAGQHVGILIDKHEHRVEDMRALVVDRVTTRAEMLAAVGTEDTDAVGDGDSD